MPNSSNEAINQDFNKTDVIFFIKLNIFIKYIFI